MACRRCGCRMLTKVGRSGQMLICTDCGLPEDQRETAALKRKRLWGGLTLMGLASLGATLLLLVSLKEMQTGGGMEASSKGEREGSRQSRSSSDGGAFFHPGGVVQYR